MTEVEFHFNVGDKLDYSCRLLRKAHAGGAKLLVTADPVMLAQLDQMLWTLSATEFLPHCRSDAPPATLALSAIVLAAYALAPDLEGRAMGVLVNLGQDVPQGFESFERFIEIVSSAPDDRQAGRQRWNHYKQRGYALKAHDRTAPAQSSASGQIQN
jgi:DNA polymerase-3 subunit chi